MTDRPMRADAARNRARLLEVAYETFAAEGLAVPVDEIARRAGVGPGTVYRHFPTKEALFEAVIAERVGAIVEQTRSLLATDPDTALFAFIHEMACFSAADQGLFEALDSYGIDMDTAAPGAEAMFLELLAELLAAAQRAGTAREDIGVAELKALLTVCKATNEYDPEVVRRVTAVIEAGLRASPVAH